MSREKMFPSDWEIKYFKINDEARAKMLKRIDQGGEAWLERYSRHMISNIHLMPEAVRENFFVYAKEAWIEIGRLQAEKELEHKSAGKPVTTAHRSTIPGGIDDFAPAVVNDATLHDLDIKANT